MARVHIVQLLCPRRHCIIDTAYEEGEKTSVDARQSLLDVLWMNNIKPWCVLCGSRKLTWEDVITQFHSVEQALAHLHTLGLENTMTPLTQPETIKYAEHRKKREWLG